MMENNNFTSTFTVTLTKATVKTIDSNLIRVRPIGFSSKRKKLRLKILSILQKNEKNMSILAR